MFNLFSSQKNAQVDDLKDVEKEEVQLTFKRYENNPIITPLYEQSYRAKAVFSPTAIRLDDMTHIVFRAQANDGTSTFGYANSLDGININEILAEPIYSPREDFEMPTKAGWNSGCEDPRITKLGDRLYLTYAAYDGTSPPRVALSSISVNDFLNRNWLWEKARLISPPGVDDKDACIVKNHGKGYIAFHRLGNAMWIDFLRDLTFPSIKYLTGGIIAQAREELWDNVKIGIAGPPLETERGWLLLYHAVSNPGFQYKIGAMLLDYDNPHTIIARSASPLLEPKEGYELFGQVPNVVFSCGAVLNQDIVYLYYGGADSVVCVATMPLSDLLASMTSL